MNSLSGKKKDGLEMKKLPSVKAVLLAITVICSIEIFTNLIEGITIISLDSAYTTASNAVIESVMLKNQTKKLQEKELKFDEKELKQEIEIISLKASTPAIVYEGMTLDELALKLNNSLSSDLSGYGMSFAKYSTQYGVDPYLALAITLLETGCKWGCSSLVKQCNNVGGMKGSGSCLGSSYATFASLDAGIEAMIKNLSYNYIQKGLVTPEQINRKYATSSTWAYKVNNYINAIRNT